MDVSLMLDAMSIRKHVQYNPHTQSTSGFVDMGDGNSETDVATEALVFMVVGLQGHWKAPIAYFLTKSLSLQKHKGSFSVMLLRSYMHRYSGGMCNNGWSCLQCQHVQPTWV